jgi:hypothetical protein
MELNYQNIHYCIIKYQIYHLKQKKIIELVKKYGLQSSKLTLKRRHMAHFYTSWDAAGGCIWNNKSIKNFNLLYHKPKNTNNWIKL